MSGANGVRSASAAGIRDAGSVFGTGEPDTKKRKTMAKSKPAFNPQPVKPGNPSMTASDEHIHIPPPPSEKRIARRRESTKAMRERDRSESPSQPPTKVQKVGAASTSKRKGKETSVVPGVEGGVLSDELGGERGRWDQAMNQAGSSKTKSTEIPHLDFLQLITTSKPRPSVAKPVSPPRHFFPPSSSLSKSTLTSMAPPSGVPTRKSRQSVRGGMGIEISTDSLEPVPISDTPVIRKNQEMRKEAQRRSSLGMRGQRASSSLGRGEISIPHKSVPTETFYKHISTHTPEPIRVRHILIWCAKRALDASIHPEPKKKSKSKDKAREVDDGPKTKEGDELVKQILEDFMGNLGRGGVDTNVFAAPADFAFNGQLRPHPANMSNRELEAKEESIIKRARNEDAQWTSLIRRANAKQADMTAQLKEKISQNLDPDMSTSEEWMRKALSLADEIINEGTGDLTSMGEFSDVEYKIDTLHQTSHSLVQYSLQATNFLDGIFTALSSDLKKRETIGLPRTTTDTDVPDATTLLNAARQTTTTSASSSKKPDPINMLRALASAEARYQSNETVELAASLPPVQAVVVGSMTPRRPVGMTPRRTGTLGGVGTSTTPATAPSKAKTPGR